MKDKLSSQAKELLRVFPEIPVSKANELDIGIKAKLLAYQSTKINEDISNYIQMEIIEEYVRSKNTHKIKKKCNKLAAYYLENNRQWILQENWYGILAFIITVVTMICRVLEIDTSLNDTVSFGMYLCGLVAWLGIVGLKKFMGKEAEIFLNAFSQNAPLIIFVWSFMFYCAVFGKKEKIIWIICIGLLVVHCFGITILWYRRQRKA